MILVFTLLFCAVTLAAGANAKWALKPPEAALYERVVTSSKSCPALSYLLAPPLNRSLDRAQVQKFVRSKVLDDGGYGLLDEATKREAALRTAGEKSDSPESELVYHALRSRLRLSLSLSKVAVARRMASPATKSYGIQAMESGIDSMRDAASELEMLEKTVHPRPGEVSSTELWEFHRRLLEIWDTAKRRDDLSLIKNVDLQGLAKEVIKPVASR
jgi:hypothetical protein